MVEELAVLGEVEVVPDYRVVDPDLHFDRRRGEVERHVAPHVVGQRHHHKVGL